MKIGEITRIESIKACKCLQCGEWFYYQRITSTYCSDKCRQRARRGAEPTDKYKHGIMSQNERILAMIAEKSPSAFQKLAYIKNHYGQNALDRALEVIIMLGVAS